MLYHCKCIIADRQLEKLSNYDLIVISWTFSKRWSVILEQNFRCRIAIDDHGLTQADKQTLAVNGKVIFVDEESLMIAKLLIPDFDKILDNETFIANN